MRVCGAVAVFLSHAKRQSITGGFLAEFGVFGAEGVAVFFVISGTVIAHVVATKERAFVPYMASRLTRLWSVVVPAIVVTILADGLGRAVAPIVYRDVPAWTLSLGSLWRALAPILFLNKLGPLSADPGSNGPFWSLCYEFWHYVAFACACFTRGWLRAGLICLVAVATGRSIVLLAPVWLLGAAVYAGLGRRGPSRMAWVGIVIGMLGLYSDKFRFWDAVLGFMGTTPAASPHLAECASAYFTGIAFAASILLFDQIGADLSRPLKFVERPIRFCAQRSFSLYLYQAPLLFLFGALTYRVESRPLRIVMVYVATLASVAVLAEFTERRKYIVSRLLSAIGAPDQATPAALAIRPSTPSVSPGAVSR